MKNQSKKSLVILNDCMFTASQISLLKKRFIDVAVYKDTSSEDVAIKRIENRNIVIMDQFMFTLSEKLLKACKKLELLIVNTTAYDKIDINLLNKYHVKLAHLRDYATHDVAEVGIGMVMALNNRIETARKIVKGQDIGFKEYTLRESINDICPGHPVIPYLIRKPLSHQTIGIIGLGNIGQRSAELAQGLGMKVLGFNRTRKYVPGVELVPLSKLLSQSDIIYISLSYDKHTMRHFLNANHLRLIKNNALLVSVSHPDLIDMEYVIKNDKRFGGIGLDYLVTEDVLRLLNVRKSNIIITPHLGSQSIEAYSNLTETIIEAAISYTEGKPLYLVN